MSLVRLRWRLNDPSEENVQRWTMTHLLHPGTAATATGTFGGLATSSDEVTLCGRVVPEHAYMMDRDDQIPEAAETCFRCHQRSKRFA